MATSSDELDRSHTRHFYPVDEAMSAIQKAVRRGLVEEAVFWARELNCSGLSRVLADRMLVLSVEDVGIASVESCRWVVMLRQSYLSHRDPTIGCTFLEAGIWALASHPCNRMSCVACLWQRSRVHFVLFFNFKWDAPPCRYLRIANGTTPSIPNGTACFVSKSSMIRSN